jgi:Bacterial protein of unknown function (DUF916)./Protein of unknown function C-terminal (DUF3324).
MGIQNKKPLFLNKVAIITFILFGVISIPFPVTATSHTSPGFYVHAKLPQNQIDKELGYFDLRMQPNQIQQLEVEVINEFDNPISVTVEAISASTNRNGIIDYKTPDIQDETLSIPFSSISVVEQNSILIPAKSTKTAIVTITMPNEQFDGIILGGLVFTCENDVENQSQTTSINNIFSYVIGVKLSETDVKVVPQFEIVKITPETMNYHPVFVHAIRNTEAAIVKNMNIEISVTDTNGVVQAQTSKSNVDMAPNSVMPLGVSPNNGQLYSGEYISNIQMEYNNQTYQYQIPFSVTDSNITEINTQIFPDNFSNPQLHNFMPFIKRVLIANFMIVSLLLIVFLKRRRKKGDENGEQ